MFCYFGKIYQIETCKTYLSYDFSKVFIDIPIHVIVKVAFYIKDLCRVYIYT